MPYQVYSNPNLAAQLRVQGGQAFANGISSGMAQLARGATQAIEEQKNLKAQAKAFLMLNKSLPEPKAN